MSRSDILDTSGVGGGELAVRLAISETQILQENKEYFESHGVNISALESLSSATKAAKRSNTTLLVKNLPYDVVDTELEDMFAKYGSSVLQSLLCNIIALYIADTAILVPF